MPRARRITIPALPHHIIQRGNNRQAIFFADEDYRFYLQCLRQAKAKCACRIYAYVLMTNHVHLLVEPTRERDLGAFHAECRPQVCPVYQPAVRAHRNALGGLV